MNREIKFRVWDSDINDMNYSDGDNEMLQYFFHGFSFESQHKTLQQYTGLKDKNGKEIYEGDIVKYNDDSGTRQTGVVDNYGYMSIYIKAIGGDEEGNQNQELHIDCTYEIIGNIYEDSQLLDAKQYIKNIGSNLPQEQEVILHEQ